MISVLLAVACDGAASDEPGGRVASAAVPITGNELIRGDILGLPNQIALIGGRLVVADRAGAPFVHIVDRATGSLLRSVGRRGEGPGEFSGVRAVLDFPGEDDVFWVFDPALRRLSKLSLEPSLPENAPIALHMLTLESPGVVDPIWMSPTTLLGAGLLRDASFIRIEIGADSSAVLGERTGPPPPGPEEVPADFRIAMYQGRLAVRPDRSLLIKGYLNAGRIDIYDATGELISLADVPEPFEPEFVPSERPGRIRGRWTVKNDRRGYVDVAASNDLFFGLYSGVLYTDEPATRAMGQRVDIFDWSGTYRTSLTLDVPNGVAIAVDPAATRMWLVVHDPEPAIRVYWLGDAL